MGFGSDTSNRGRLSGRPAVWRAPSPKRGVQEKRWKAPSTRLVRHFTGEGSGVSEGSEWLKVTRRERVAFGPTPLPLAALSCKPALPYGCPSQQGDSGHDLTCTNTQGAGGGQSGDRLKVRPQQSPSGEMTMAQTRGDTRHGDRASGPLESHGCGYSPH